MDVRALTIALGCDVSEAPGTSSRPPSASAVAVSETREPSQNEVLASESWEEFEERCHSPATSSLTSANLEKALAGFRDDTALAQTTVVWKTDNGSSRERLLLIRSCARLGRAGVVLVLLQHNPITEALCEDLFLDAIHGDKRAVVQGLLGSRFFDPAKGFLGYALAECGASRSAGCAAYMIEDERCRAQALQQCDHERFGLPPWSYLRALEDAIVRAIEAGARDRNDAASPSSGAYECLQLLSTFAKEHLQDGEWQRILRLAIVKGETNKRYPASLPFTLATGGKASFSRGIGCGSKTTDLRICASVRADSAGLAVVEVPPCAAGGRLGEMHE